MQKYARYWSSIASLSARSMLFCKDGHCIIATVSAWWGLFSFSLFVAVHHISISWPIFASDPIIFYLMLAVRSCNDCGRRVRLSSSIQPPKCPAYRLPNLRVVLKRRGQLNDGRNLLHYRLQTTFYDPSTRTPHTFPLTAFFKNG